MFFHREGKADKQSTTVSTSKVVARMADKPTMQPQPPTDDAAPKRCDKLRDVVLTRAHRRAAAEEVEAKSK